jgi:hypothetical protein
MPGKRLLQVFISDSSTNPGPGIYEVSTDQEKNLSCTCPGFIAKTVCKHTQAVERKIDKNDGVYPFDFSEKITIEELTAAMKDEKLFRELVIKHGKIEVY